MKPFAKKKAIAMSQLFFVVFERGRRGGGEEEELVRQTITAAIEGGKEVGATYGIWFENAAKACAKVRVFVIMDAQRPIMATAPSGSGAVMIPTIVATKIAKRCQA